MIALHNILEQLWRRWCCCEEVHLGPIPIIDWSNILFHCWHWPGMPLLASHAVILAWLDSAQIWEKFQSHRSKCTCKSPQIYNTGKNNTNSTATIFTALHDFESHATSFQMSCPGQLALNTSNSKCFASSRAYYVYIPVYIYTILYIFKYVRRRAFFSWNIFYITRKVFHKKACRL